MSLHAATIYYFRKKQLSVSDRSGEMAAHRCIILFMLLQINTNLYYRRIHDHIYSRSCEMAIRNA